MTASVVSFFENVEPAPKPKRPRKHIRLHERKVPRGQEKLTRLFEGQWVRAAWYTEGHKVGRDLRTAICGRPLDLELHAWVVDDLRKTGKCSWCNREKDWTEAPQTHWTEMNSDASRLPTERMARQAALQFEAKVALVKRLLGATEV